MGRKFKLSIEMVPAPCAQVNIRNLLGRERWNRIRTDTLWKADYTCQICGEKGVWLQVHEQWGYDDINHIQKLKGFIALCAMCHLVKHIGFAFILYQKGELDYDELIEHFMEVNHCKEETFFKHLEKQVRINNERNGHSWTTIMDDYLPKPKAKHRPVYIEGRCLKP